MTTPLLRPLSREILLGGTAYRVTMSADRLTLAPKGRRKGAVQLTWDELLNWHARGGAIPPSAHEPTTPSPPRSVLTQVASEIAAATTALSRADATLTQAGALPPELRMSLSPDPHHGRTEERSDWFIEPLLTGHEVASLLRVSTRAVRRLPIRPLSIGGQVRYRQSEIRAYLQKQAPKSLSW